MKKWNPLALYFVLIFGMLLAGCGGGGSSTSGTNNLGTASKTVTGVAATGTPISGTVYMKDSSNPAKEVSTPINSDGSYSFDVTSLTAPFILKAVGTANGQTYTLYSVASTPGIANINPLSHLAVVQANGGVDPAALYTNLTPAQVEAIKTTIAIIIPQIQAMLQQILSQYGVASTNFVSDKYTANHTGLDLLFDMITIAINNGTLTMFNNTSGAAILTTTLNGNTLSGLVVTANIPTIASQTMGTVYAYPSIAAVATGSTILFKAIVVGTTNQAVTWNVIETNGGSITSAGIYTAPANAGTYHVKATSIADTNKSSTTTVSVTAPGSTTKEFTAAMISGKTFSSFEFNVLSNGNPQKDGTAIISFNANGTLSNSNNTVAGTWIINSSGQVVVTYPSLGTATMILTSTTSTSLTANVSWSYTESIGTSTLYLIVLLN